MQVQETPKEPKAQKAPKTQRHNQVKAQSPNNRAKIKNALKNISGVKTHLFAYMRFCAREEIKIRKKRIFPKI